MPLHAYTPLLHAVKTSQPRGYVIYSEKSCKFITCNSFDCGERGIRTPGGVTLNGFQDRRNRPLCHLSFAIAGVVPVLRCKGRAYF